MRARSEYAKGRKFPGSLRELPPKPAIAPPCRLRSGKPACLRPEPMMVRRVCARQQSANATKKFVELPACHHLEAALQSQQSLRTGQARLRAKFALEQRGRGRPPLDIDPVAVYLLARDGHSARAIAQYLLCHPGTIRRRFRALLQSAREYRMRWSWLGQDVTLELLQREGHQSSLPAPVLTFMHRTNDRRRQKRQRSDLVPAHRILFRQQARRRAGRPKLAINKEQVLELLLQGYTPQGIAPALSCSVRTLERRFPELLAGHFDPSTLNRLLFRSAIGEGNLPGLLLLARRLVRQDRRRAEREEEAEIQTRIRGEL